MVSISYHERLVLLVCLVLALSGVAGYTTSAQDINIDSIRAILNNDKDCGDFDDRMAAQSHFEALDKIVLGPPDQDPHSLDRDGNGYACEGKQYIRWISFSNKIQIRTVEKVHSVMCQPFIEGWINIRDFQKKMINAPFEQIEYMPSMQEAECLDTLFEIYKSQ